MAVTGKVYGQAQLKINTGTIDLDTDSFKLMLVDNSNVPDLDADDFRDDRTTGELTATNGYTTGGVALASITVTYDSASDQVRFDSADPTIPFSGAKTWRYGDIYKVRGGASSADELLLNLTWDADQTVSTSYTLTVDPTGWAQWDVT